MTAGGVTLPPFACIPGKTPRHAPGAFDGLHATVEPGMSVDALASSNAFAAGFSFFDAGYFWEAHEVWEPVWLALPQKSTERQFVQALIQLANAELKLRMQRPRAARRLCAIALAHLAEAGRQGATQIMGQDVATVGDRIGECTRRAAEDTKCVL